MKKNVFSLPLVAILFAFFSTTAIAKPATSNIEVKALTAEQTQRVKELEAKVLEIKKMDFSSLSKTEKKEIKEELRGIKKEAKALNSGGVYISTGALILILILLIIIL